MTAALLSSPRSDFAELRRSRRDDVFFPTILDLPGSVEVDVQLVNLSAHGFMARSRAEIELGAAVRLRLPMLGLVPATVVWALGGRIGAEFAVPIGEPEYEPLLAAMCDGHSEWQFR